MTQIDTPDYQQSTVSAQKLLAVGAGADTSLTVGVPPNAETLIVALSSGSMSDTATVTGLTSNIEYSGGLLVGSATSGFTETWAFDVSAPVDSQVTVELGAAPGKPWYVYADSGVHVVADLANRRDPSGGQLVIPIIPGTMHGYHPPDEMQVIAVVLAADGAVLAAPAAGQRYRIYSAQVAASQAGLLGYVYDTVSGSPLVAVCGVGSPVITLPPQGFAVSAAAGLGWVISAGGGSNTVIIVYYTTETI